MVKNIQDLTPRSSWLAVISIAFATFAAVTTEFMPVGLLTSIAADLGVSTGTAGWMVTVPGLVAAITVPLLLVFAGRLDRRHVMFGLATLVIASNLLAVVAPTFAVMLVARMLLGVAVGGLWAVAPSLGMRLVREHQVPKATALIMTGISLGTVLGLPAGTLIGDLAGWRAAFGVTAGLGVFTLLTHVFLLPALPSLRALSPRDLTGLLNRGPVRLALLLTITLFLGQFVAYTYVEPFLRDEAGVSSGTISALFLLYGVSGLVANLAASTWIGRYPVATLTGGAMLVGSAMALLPVLGESAVGAALLLIVWGAGFGVVPLALQLRLFAATPDAPEGGGGLLVTTIQIAIASGAVLGGLVVNASGASTVMLLGATLVAANLLVVAASQSAAARRREPVLASAE